MINGNVVKTKIKTIPQSSQFLWVGFKPFPFMDDLLLL
jgi:hypothetical protein